MPGHTFWDRTRNNRSDLTINNPLSGPIPFAAAGDPGIPTFHIDNTCGRVNVSDRVWNPAASGGLGPTILTISGAPINFSGNVFRADGSGDIIFQGSRAPPSIIKYESEITDTEQVAPIIKKLDEKEMSVLKSLLHYKTPEQLKQLTNAYDMVKRWLSEKEWNQLKEKGYIGIKSTRFKGRVYRVYQENRKIQFQDADGKTKEMCTNPDFSFCSGDRFLDKVVALKTDEDYVIKHSNIF